MLNRRSIFAVAGVLCLVFVFVYALRAANEPAGRARLGADHALTDLKAGNERFASGRSAHPNSGTARAAETARDGQQPFASVLACSDSRLPVELLCDCGIGDLFVIRVAGNVCGVDETASIEYGVEHLGTPLLVVLGHTQCGAVSAVVTGAETHGSLPALLAHVEPALKSVERNNPKLRGDELIVETIKANVWQSIEELLANSKIVREAAASGKLKIEGALYDVASGKIEWMGPHPQQQALLGAPH